MLTPLDYQIAAEIYQADTKCRSELASNPGAKKETAYTQAFCTRIRDSQLASRVIYFAEELTHEPEIVFGCDAMIAVVRLPILKIGLFEAKWNREPLKDNHSWDWRETKSKQSHFSNQLKSQSNWATSCAIWEMFYHAIRPGVLKHPYDRFGSTCVWHDKAIAHSISSSAVWKTRDIKAVIRSPPKTYWEQKFGQNIHSVILRLLSCKAGKKLDINVGSNRVNILGKDRSISMPIPLTRPQPEEIRGFMRDTGLKHLTFVNATGLDFYDTYPSSTPLTPDGALFEGFGGGGWNVRRHSPWQRGVVKVLEESKSMIDQISREMSPQISQGFKTEKKYQLPQLPKPGANK